MFDLAKVKIGLDRRGQPPLETISSEFASLRLSGSVFLDDRLRSGIMKPDQVDQTPTWLHHVLPRHESA